MTTPNYSLPTIKPSDDIRLVDDYNALATGVDSALKKVAESIPAPTPTPEPGATEKNTYVVIGDSLSYGKRNTGKTNLWDIFKEMFGYEIFNMSIDADIAASEYYLTSTGFTKQLTKANENEAIDTSKVKGVILLAGAFDILHGTSSYNIRTAVSAFLTAYESTKFGEAKTPLYLVMEPQGVTANYSGFTISCFVGIEYSNILTRSYPVYFCDLHACFVGVTPVQVTEGTFGSYYTMSDDYASMLALNINNALNGVYNPIRCSETYVNSVLYSPKGKDFNFIVDLNSNNLDICTIRQVSSGTTIPAGAVNVCGISNAGGAAYAINNTGGFPLDVLVTKSDGTPITDKQFKAYLKPNGDNSVIVFYNEAVWVLDEGINIYINGRVPV